MTQEKVGPIRQGVMWLRKLMLPSSGFVIGENVVEVKKDTTQDLWFRRQDGSEVNLSGSPASARVYNSGAITVPNNSLTALTFDSERFDTDSIHSTASNTGRLTCVTAGKYYIAANANFASNSTGRRSINLRLNGSAYIANHEWDTSQNGRTYMAISTLYNLEVGDYIECIVYQNSGGNLDVEAQANVSPEFMMARLGPVGTGAPAVGDDHGGLTGLSDDDHALYLLAAGSRAGSTGTAQDFGATGIKADVIAESTAATGVTIDGVKLKDTSVFTDAIESSSGAGNNIVISLGDTGDYLVIDQGQFKIQSNAAITNYAYTAHTSTACPGWQLVKSRGTVAAPSAVSASDFLGEITFQGYGATFPSDSAAIKARATENFVDGTDSGGRMEFWTTPNNTAALVLRGFVDQDGELNLHEGLNITGDNDKILLGTGSDGQIYSSGDDVHLHNVTQDADLVLGVDDGGTSKTITWDASEDKLKHSAGTFNFDDDDVTTAGNITASNIVTDSIAEKTGDTGVTVDGVTLMDSFAQFQEIATPASPSPNFLRLFARANGGNIELVALSSEGAEAVLATLDDTAGAHTNLLTLNWIE